MAKSEEQINIEYFRSEVETSWASRVINTLLTETEKGNLSLPKGYVAHGVSIQRNMDDTGWSINFQIREVK